MTDRELMQQALDAMLHFPNDISDEMFESIRVLRARLAQPEPDDGYCQACEGNHCTAKNGCVARDNPPLQRDEAPAKAVEWQGLTQEDKREIIDETEPEDRGYVMALVEAKLKEKNA